MEKNGRRSTRDIVICVETKVIDLKTHFSNHLRHHEEREKEDRKYRRDIKLVTYSALLVGSGSLLIGLALIFIKWYSS